MIFYLRTLLFVSFSYLFVACTGSGTYNIQSDSMIIDLNSRVSQLEEDLTTLNSELEQVRTVLKDNDIEVELKKSIRKEILEGERYILELGQWISYLKVQRKQRFQSLYDRKGTKSLKEEALEEIRAYELQKKLKPIPKPWKNRYKTAIEL